ncbi:lectin [Streptacidiphilus sp. EB129]|uniref:lectin n=1 Tax=Streptacidiphilus sp. EB129 TaxID=3156262 RepID=UPI003511E28D
MIPQPRGTHRFVLPLLTAGALLVTGATTAPALAAAPARASAKPAALVTAPASLVNPFIGTSNSADDFPGADLPFGMVQWSPDTPSRPDGGGYEYNDSSITGFSLTHLAGPGCGAGGDIPVLPTVGAIDTGATDAFSHTGESAAPGSYTVSLGNGVKTELAATTRSGMARFTFPSSTQSNLVFKLAGSQNGDSNTQFTTVNSSEVSGQVTSGKFCGAGNSYTVYFDMVFDHPFAGHGTAAVRATPSSTPPQTGVSPHVPEAKNKPVLHGARPRSSRPAAPQAAANDGYVTFDTTADAVVQAKVGISYVSTADAVANRTAENPNWDFDGVRSAGLASWNSLLGRVSTAGGSAAQQAVFYTALYHSLLHPNVVSDSNGQYPGFDAKTHTVDAGHSAAYANYSGWDIYRSQAQLEALVDPQAASDTAQSMIDDYAQTGQFPKWSENNGESYVMVGDPADEIIADYHAFGATNFDTATALTDMVAEGTGANNNRPGLNYLEQLGYLPSDGSYGCCNFYGPASTTLEYNSADFAISALAGALGDTAHQSSFADRAQDWRNLFDYGSGFVQPRDQRGPWTSGFSATSGNNFVEGDSWQYTAMVPFNLHGLVGAMGGDAAFGTFLDTDLSSFTGGGGHTDLGNEPSLDIPWEYDYIGRPYRTQQVVRQVQDQIWTDSAGGLAGNDDLGEMSSWYVWSALGMYPETPGTADLALGSPQFTQAVVTLPSGGTLTVNGNGAADNAPYVQSATWNGAAWNNAYAPTGAISDGGTLGFTLGTTANTSWASAASAAPPSYPGAPTYTDAGVSADAASATANFDGGGWSYSATALSDAGISPGSTVSAGGTSFTWPAPAPGQPDNYLANGQSVPASGSGSISFLGAASNGPSSGTATVVYTDGSSQSVPLAFSDWTLNGGSATALPGSTVAATLAYRNQAGAGSDAVKTYLFASAPVGLTAGKTVASVRLPSDVGTGGLHVFAIGFGAAVTAHVGPIVSGVSAGLCVDDLHSATSNGNPVDLYTCNGTGAQQWTVGTDGTLRALGGCLDVTSSGTGNGTKVQWYGCNGTGAQTWQPGAAGSLVNPASGKCLDDPGSSTVPGTQLQIYTCNATNAQNWTLP